MPATRPRSVAGRPSRRLTFATAVVAAGAWADSPRSRRTRSACRPPTSRSPAAAIKAVPGSRAQGWLGQGRSEVLARHGMVATSDPLAAQAGLEILRQGGNAIDAAVATGAVLDVTSQNDTGIGGDLFALVWVGEGQEALRAELRRLGAGRLDAGVLHREARREARAGQRRELGDRARRDLRLRRAAEALRHDDASRRRSSARRGSPRKAGAWPSAGTRICATRVKGLRADPDSRQTFLDRRRRRRLSTASSAIPAWRRRCG